MLIKTLYVTSFFTKIQSETVMVYKKGQKDAIPEERPLQRAIDIIEATLKVSILFPSLNYVERMFGYR